MIIASGSFVVPAQRGGGADGGVTACRGASSSWEIPGDAYAEARSCGGGGGGAASATTPADAEEDSECFAEDMMRRRGLGTSDRGELGGRRERVQGGPGRRREDDGLGECRPGVLQGCRLSADHSQHRPEPSSGTAGYGDHHPRECGGDRVETTGDDCSRATDGTRRVCSDTFSSADKVSPTGQGEKGETGRGNVSPKLRRRRALDGDSGQRGACVASPRPSRSAATPSAATCPAAACGALGTSSDLYTVNGDDCDDAGSTLHGAVGGGHCAAGGGQIRGRGDAPGASREKQGGRDASGAGRRGGEPAEQAPLAAAATADNSRRHLLQRLKEAHLATRKQQLQEVADKRNAGLVQSFNDHAERVARRRGRGDAEDAEERRPTAADRMAAIRRRINERTACNNGKDPSDRSVGAEEGLAGGRQAEESAGDVVRRNELLKIHLPTRAGAARRIHDPACLDRGDNVEDARRRSTEAAGAQVAAAGVGCASVPSATANAASRAAWHAVGAADVRPP